MGKLRKINLFNIKKKLFPQLIKDDEFTNDCLTEGKE